MTNLSETINIVINQLDELDLKREVLFKSARSLNRISGKGIALILQNNQDYKKLISEGKIILEEIHKLMNDLSNLVSWNSISSEVEEYSEFLILSQITETGFISDIPKIIPPNIWLSSLGDVVGELRRFVLKCIIENKYDEAKKFYNKMNEISSLMRGLVYSKTLVPNLRRKIDMVRAVTEKTDSDITNALIFHKLNQQLSRSVNE